MKHGFRPTRVPSQSQERAIAFRRSLARAAALPPAPRVLQVMGRWYANAPAMKQIRELAQPAVQNNLGLPISPLAGMPIYEMPKWMEGHLGSPVVHKVP
jgi:hypothetical protein